MHEKWHPYNKNTPKLFTSKGQGSGDWDSLLEPAGTCLIYIIWFLKASLSTDGDAEWITG